MKSYTDLEQSKELAEILPHESADMCWISIDDDESFDGSWEALPKTNSFIAKDDKQIPCWSLAALLGVLPFVSFTAPQLIGTPKTLYRCIYTDGLRSRACDNPIDACVDMIDELRRINLL